MPVVSIRHLTTYRYRNPVAFGEHRMMMRPRESYDQRLISADLHIGPGLASLRNVQDLFGNCVSIAAFTGRSDILTFDSHVVLDHSPSPAFSDLAHEPENHAGVLPSCTVKTISPTSASRSSRATRTPMASWPPGRPASNAPTA